MSLDLGLALGLFPTKRRMQLAIADAIATSVGVEVENYSALPSALDHDGQYAWCRNSQGTKWLPGTLGGTYYPKGLYFSVDGTWEFMDTPIEATLAEVNAGSVSDKFVSPYTLSSCDVVKTVQGYSSSASFPTTGRENVIYIDLTTNSTYRWNTSSSTYTSLQASTDKSVISDVNGSYWYVGYPYKIERVDTTQTPYLVEQALISSLAEQWDDRVILTYS